MHNFSLEFVICGRNDDYEPNWAQRLEAVMRYNRALLLTAGVDFRVGFTEWNPPADKPLLSPDLAQKYPYFRGVVVPTQVHEQLSQARNLSMMLNFCFNAIIRTSTADFCVISGGDDFFGRDLAQHFAAYGLERGILYRAVRVDVRNDLDFEHPTATMLEDPAHYVRVNSCIHPPFTEGCGDFLLMDRASFQMVRGFDENVRNARLHLDSRCTYTAVARGIRPRLIGTVFHINHARAYISMGAKNYEGQPYNFMQGIPYSNPDTWGLGDRKWTQRAERVMFVE